MGPPNVVIEPIPTQAQSVVAVRSKSQLRSTMPVRMQPVNTEHPPTAARCRVTTAIIRLAYFLKANVSSGTLHLVPFRAGERKPTVAVSLIFPLFLRRHVNNSYNYEPKDYVLNVIHFQI